MAKQNIGRDLSVSFSVNGAVIAQFGLHTDTSIKPQWTESKVRPTNNGGIFVARPIFGGYEVDLTYARVNSVGDDLAQFLENNFEAGFPDFNVTMLETIRNYDGTINQYQYINGIMYPTDLGSWKGAEDVPQTFKFFFPQRQAVSLQSNATVSGNVIPGIVV